MKKHAKHNLMRLKTNKVQQGVVLIEALVAIVIFSMGILAMVGLQAAMIKNTSENKIRADASYLAKQSLGQAWAVTADAAGNGNLASVSCAEGNACADVSNVLPNGQRTVTVGNRGLVTVSVTWQSPGEDPHRYTTSTYVGSL